MFYTGAAFIFSQAKEIGNNSRSNIEHLAERYYGFDDLLVNGTIYRQQNILANGSPLYNSSNFTDTQIYIKGQLFENEELKYDIVSDQLVLAKQQQNKYKLQIVLNLSFVDSFYLENRLFVNLLNLKESTIPYRYFEKIYSGKHLLLRKYKKRFEDSYDIKNPHGKFSPQKKILFILNNGALTRVNTKSEFLSFYNTEKKKVRKYMRQNKLRIKKASNPELIKLMTFCNEFIE